MSHQTENQQIVQCVELLGNVLGSDLIGIYLYGSSLVGGLQRYSDLDLLVISNRATTHKEKEKLSIELLRISGTYRNEERRSIDLIVVKQSDIKPWQYPPKFDYHYGDWMRKDFKSGNFEPWITTTMPSLALVITQVLLSSKTVSGQEPKLVLTSVPYTDFIAATIKEMDNLKADVQTDERNVLLTFARIWLTVETDRIGSKQQAAAWAIQQLPDEYKPLMQHALNSTIGTEPDEWNEMRALLEPCADLMMQQINRRVLALEKIEVSSRSISLSNL